MEAIESHARLDLELLYWVYKGILEGHSEACEQLLEPNPYDKVKDFAHNSGEVKNPSPLCSIVSLTHCQLL